MIKQRNSLWSKLHYFPRYLCITDWWEISQALWRINRKLFNVHIYKW